MRLSPANLLKARWGIPEIRKAIFFATVMLLVLSSAPPVWGAWGGELDRDGHPMVGAMYADLDESGQIEWFELICSGSYAGPTRDGSADVFLTAGHCVAPLVAFFGINEF